jgi:hypothetical protein
MELGNNGPELKTQCPTGAESKGQPYSFLLTEELAEKHHQDMSLPISHGGAVAKLKARGQLVRRELSSSTVWGLGSNSGSKPGMVVPHI